MKLYKLFRYYAKNIIFHLRPKIQLQAIQKITQAYKIAFYKYL